MGTARPSDSSFSDALFSRTRQRVLSLLFGSPERSFYANEIVRHAGIGIGTVQRELARLASTGLLTVTRLGNQKHYQANRDAPIYEELRGIVTKTFGIADVLRFALRPLRRRVAASFIYGSVASGKEHAGSDIDLMVLSDDLAYVDLIKAVQTAETTLGRKVNPALYGLGEFQRKLAERNAFLRRLMERPRIYLIGSDKDVPQPREPRSAKASQGRAARPR
ncbi:MAG: nucleotidyltransferase domain-containing protein [Steroidobacteraceae bacterium]